jgi:hypothetical protein
MCLSYIYDAQFLKVKSSIYFPSEQEYSELKMLSCYKNKQQLSDGS